jgi:O-methyltransferase domain/Dimerisation domain
MHLGMGFFGTRVMLSAVELGVFTALAKGPKDGAALRQQIRGGSEHFFDSLVSLGLLKRRGTKYANGAASVLHLDRANPKPGHVGGLLEMCARVVLSAVELGVFTELAKGSKDEAALRLQLGLHARSSRDFFDSLVSLGLLVRRGTRYANSTASALYLDRTTPRYYVGSLLETFGPLLHSFQGPLTEALRTGSPQNETKSGGHLFEKVYANPARLHDFLTAMTEASMDSAQKIALNFPWRKYQTFCDIGGAQGCVSVQLALAHKHLTGSEFDLPPVGPIFEDYVKSFRLQKRLAFVGGDFFKDALPAADVLIMGHILHDWDLEQRRALLKKAYASLPKGGALIAYDAIIDDARKQNLGGLMMSLYMSLETPGGSEYTGADCRGWMKQVGFRKTSVEPLSDVESMVIGIK